MTFPLVIISTCITLLFMIEMFTFYFYKLWLIIPLVLVTFLFLVSILFILQLNPLQSKSPSGPQIIFVTPYYIITQFSTFIRINDIFCPKYLIKIKFKSWVLNRKKKEARDQNKKSKKKKNLRLGMQMDAGWLSSRSDPS